MKKITLKTGLLTVGMLSVLAKPVKVYASEDNRVVRGSILQTDEERLVQTYADVFEVSRKTTMDKIKELTGNFEDWKVESIIGNESGYDYQYVYKLGDKEYNDIEIAILDTVRDISKHPENYDLTYEDIATDLEYTTESCGEDILKYYCDLLEVNEYAALPIMYEECYKDLSSSAYINQGNPGGMGPGNTYKNIEVGIIEYVYMLKYNSPYYFNEDTDISVYDRIGSTYCTSGTGGWISNTKQYYNDIANNYYYYADIYEKDHTDPEKVIKLH